MAFASQTETNETADRSCKDPLDAMGLPSPLILGSGSFTRKLILKEMDINYHLLVRSIDEQSIGDRGKGDPQTLVEALATAKGNHILQLFNSDKIEPSDMPQSDSNKGWILLTADQVVTHNNKILEKPLSIEQAKEFVSGYATSPPQTVGACVLTHIPSGIQVCGLDSATIHFSKSVAQVDVDGKDLVDLLLEDNAPVLSCAGGLMVEHPLVVQHVEQIDGTQDSVMGLAKHVVLKLLGEIRERLLHEKML